MGQATDARFALLFATFRLALTELTAPMVEGPGPLAPVALAEPQPLCGSSIDSESTPPETPNNAAPAAPPKDAPPAEIQKPLKSANLAECGVIEWDVEFVEVEQEILFEPMFIRTSSY